MANLYWSCPEPREGQRGELLNQGMGPLQALARKIDGTDIVYPAPGGGLLQVPVAGGVADQMKGTLAGQFPMWDLANGLWIPTPTAPSNRQVPIWDSATSRWIFTDDLNVLYRGRLFDSFLGGRTSVISAQNLAAVIGDLSWNFDLTGGTGSVSRVAPTGAQGAYSINAGSGAISAIFLGTSIASQGGFNIDDIDYVEWTGYLDSAGGSSGASSRIGIGTNALSAQGGAAAFFFERDTSLSSGNVRCICRTASANTVVASTLAGGNVRRAYRITRVAAANWVYTINGTVIATFTNPAQIPAAGTIMTSMVVAQAPVGGAMSTVIDSFIGSIDFS